MKLFSYLSFLCSLSGLALTATALWFGKREAMNRVIAIIGLFYFFWALCMVFVYGSDHPDSVFFWFSLSYVGVLGMSPCLVWLFLLFGEASEQHIRAVVIPAMVLSVGTYVLYFGFGFPYTGFRDGYFGNVGIVNAGALWPAVFPWIVAAFAVYTNVVMLANLRRTASRRMRHYIKVMIAAEGLSFVLYPLGTYLESSLGLPSTTVLQGLFTLAACFYMVVKFRYLLPETPVLSKPSEAIFNKVCRKYGISPREKDVVVLVLRGYRNSEIADTLFISLGTVKNHLVSVYKKTGAENRVELVATLSGDET